MTQPKHAGCVSVDDARTPTTVGGPDCFVLGLLHPCASLLALPAPSSSVLVAAGPLSRLRLRLGHCTLPLAFRLSVLLGLGSRHGVLGSGVLFPLVDVPARYVASFSLSAFPTLRASHLSSFALSHTKPARSKQTKQTSKFPRDTNPDKKD